jgi:hypothetical protein
MMMMMIISLFGQPGLWAPSSGLDAHCVQINRVCFQVGLVALSGEESQTTIGAESADDNNGGNGGADAASASIQAEVHILDGAVELTLPGGGLGKALNMDSSGGTLYLDFLARL